MVIVVVARKGKGLQICEKIGGVPRGTKDFRLFIFSRVPGNHDFESHILPLLDVTSESDSGGAAMAEFMLYAVCLKEHIPDADRIV